ncbi:MAG TPA: A24 family peptidase [Steroidobacteraceae bacterium]|nr:A24 family peptidase [Steroidobacteraceae bacterium]
MSAIDLLSSSLAFFVGVCFVLGLVVGSFLNVVIHRVPIIMERQWREQCEELEHPDHAATVPANAPPKEHFNLLVPRSACPACKAPITALQNIPILSYLVLRGRCANCRVRISVRYPIVEALTGILSAAVAWKLGFGLPAAAALVLTWFLVALAFIDIDTQLLPDSLTLPLLWLGLLLSLFAPAAGLAPIPVDMRSSIIGAIAGYLCLWTVYHLFRLLTAKEGMGYGDFKLLAALGAWLGWQMLLPTVLIAAAVGAVAGVALLTARGQNRATPIAFGPFLAAGGWLMLLFGRELVTDYLGLFGR